MAIIYINNYNIMNETEINMDMIDWAMGWMGAWEMEMLMWGQGLGASWIDLWMIQSLWIGLNIFQIVTFLLTAWGLFMISKKLWEKHSWLSFVPILQLYNYFAVSKRSVAQTLVYPIIALIIWGILAIFTFWISLIIAVIYLLVMVIKLYHAISVRCWRWAWTTVWFLFVPFIMFPIVWKKLDDKSWWDSGKKETKKEEKVLDTESTDDDVEY